MKEVRLREELANVFTHGIGIPLSIAGLVLLVVAAARDGDAFRIVAASVYGASLVLLYTSSTCYHSMRCPRWRHVFRKIDHAAIFVLIAGTYTPFTLVNLRGGWGWSLFGVTWGIAAAGIFTKAFWTGRFEILSTAAYVAMGWLVIIAIKPTMAAVDLGGLLWLVAGGLAYTFGVIFYAMRRMPYHHAVWHLFVLAGSACHYVAVLQYARD